MKLSRTHVVACCLLAAMTLPPAASAHPPGPVTDTDIQAREAAITGKPPRIAPLKPDEYGAEYAAAVSSLRQAVPLPSTDNADAEYVTTMLRHPQLLQRQVELSVQLFRGELVARDRELAVLRTAWLCQAPYEWGEHVAIGKRLGGLTSAEIERVTIGSTAPGWSEHDRAILRAVEELFADAMISDATWAELALSYDDKQLLEFPVLVGYYQSIAYLQNSVRFRLRAENPGLSAR